MTFTHALSINNYGTAKFIVSANAYEGTHTTIASALTSASSGETIFIRTGTYTENLTLKAGVNLTAFGSDASINGTGKVIISGTCTMTTAGSVTISGIQLQTNSAALLAVTGSAASIVNLENCYLNMTNNTGITFSSSNAAANIRIENCYGDLGTTNIAIFAHSSAGTLNLNTFICTNTGLSTTANTLSAGTLGCNYVVIANPITVTSTGTMLANYSSFNCQVLNVTALTLGGTNHTFINSDAAGGSASAISIGTTATITNFVVNSSNANAITGAGTIVYDSIAFAGSSKTINTTTQTGGTIQGSKNTAPSAGFLGQQLSSSATAVALVSATPKTVASVVLTAGVWDLSAIATSTPTGGTGLQQAFSVGISTTDNSLSGTIGIDYGVITSSALGVCTISVPNIRVTTTGTTYYVVAQSTYSSTTCPVNGRLSATRVG